VIFDRSPERRALVKPNPLVERTENGDLEDDPDACSARVEEDLEDLAEELVQLADEATLWVKGRSS
jgi:hypothetical protein